MKKYLTQKLALVLIIIGGVGTTITQILSIANIFNTKRDLWTDYAITALSYIFQFTVISGILVLVYVMAYKNQKK